MFRFVRISKTKISLYHIRVGVEDSSRNPCDGPGFDKYKQ